ncbi:MAG: hypothetical protein JO199_12565, partial [Candidatus Eremiobacteraeota bacterium]|nr:hypothetical protein [Candidatus Eremiobacteraeota bacterium]
MVLSLFLVASVVLGAGLVRPVAAGAAGSHATPTPNAPIVINFTVISASRGAAILRSIY